MSSGKRRARVLCRRWVRGGGWKGSLCGSPPCRCSPLCCESRLTNQAGPARHKMKQRARIAETQSVQFARKMHGLRSVYTCTLLRSLGVRFGIDGVVPGTCACVDCYWYQQQSTRAQTKNSCHNMGELHAPHTSLGSSIAGMLPLPPQAPFAAHARSK